MTRSILCMFLFSRLSEAFFNRSSILYEYSLCSTVNYCELHLHTAWQLQTMAKEFMMCHWYYHLQLHLSLLHDEFSWLKIESLVNIKHKQLHVKVTDIKAWCNTLNNTKYQYWIMFTDFIKIFMWTNLMIFILFYFFF